MLSQYGSLVGVMIGFASISSEMRGKALNTLIAKPLYRDSIINGKLLGALCFLVVVFVFSTVFYIAGLLVVGGSFTASILPVLLVRVPAIIGIALIYMMIFLSISMLITILVRGQAFALILSYLSIFVSDLIPGYFAGSIAMLLGNANLMMPIIEMSPSGVMFVIR